MRRSALLVALAFLIVMVVTVVVPFITEGGDPSLEHQDLAPAPAPKAAARRSLEVGGEPSVAPEVRPAAAAAAAPTFVREEPAHEPDLGELCDRGSARAEFEILDAAGVPLNWSAYRDAKARLHRRIGDYAVEETAKIDSSHDAVVCSSRSGLPLEPGHFVLQVAVGDYGILRHEFVIGRTEHRRETLRMPRARSIVVLEFVDPEGAPIEWLRELPNFVRSKTGDPSEPAGRAPMKVLLDPPLEFDFTMSGSSSSSFSRRTRYTSNALWATAGGRVCVEVVAGIEGLITMKGGDLFATDVMELRGDFAEPGWRLHRVVLTPTAALAAAVEKDRRLGTADPGRQSLLAEVAASRFSEIDRVQEPDPQEVESAVKGGQYRFIFEDEKAATYRPSLRARSRFGGRLVPCSLELAGGVWFGNPPMKGETLFALGDGAFLRERPVELAPPDSSSSIVRRRVEGDFDPLAVTLEMTPTLAGYAGVVEAALTGVPGDAAPFHPTCRPALRLDRRTFGLETRLSSLVDPRVDPAVQVVIGLTPKAEGDLRVGANGEVTTGSAWTCRLPFRDEDRQAMFEGHLELELGAGGRPVPKTLALRIVDELGGGLAFVAGSIFPLEDDALARAMRETSMRLAASGRRTEIERDWIERSESTGDYSPEEVDSLGPISRSLVPSAEDRLRIAEYFPQPEQQSRLARFGAWYDTRNRLESDDYGYVIARDLGLVPGRSYVLYLWSQSADDLQPDRRLVFDAADGITDLGVIRMAPARQR